MDFDGLEDYVVAGLEEVEEAVFFREEGRVKSPAVAVEKKEGVRGRVEVEGGEDES